MTSRVDGNRPLEVRTAAALSQAAPVADTEDGIVVNDHAVARNLLRWGGGAVAVGGGVLLATQLAKVGPLARTSYLLPVGIAVAGAALLGASFLGGLQPKVQPFAQSGLPSFEAAVQAAAALREDVGIYRQSGGQFALVDLASKQLDTNPNDNDPGNQQIPWAGLVTRDGDLLQDAGGRLRNQGRAFPAAIDLATIDPDNPVSVRQLVGQQVGTTDDHRTATLGQQVGEPSGYATFAEAVAAAYGAPGNTAILAVGKRSFLFDAVLPDGARAPDVAARGAGIAPIRAVIVQQEQKLYGAGAPGADLSFVGRATPFHPAEPVGRSVGGRTIGALAQSHGSQQEAMRTIANDNRLVDDVFFGRRAGQIVIGTSDPDGTRGYHRYDLTGATGGPAWDQQMGEVTGLLERDRRRRHEQFQTGSTEYDALIWNRSFSRTTANLRDLETSRTTVLRDSNWVEDGPPQIDWYMTNRLREDLRWIREHPPVPPAGGDTDPPAGGDTDPIPGGGTPGGGDTDPVPGRPGSGDTGGDTDPLPGTGDGDTGGDGRDPGDSSDAGDPDFS